MKFEIDFTEPQVQVSFAAFTNGGQISIYFYSGERYEHDAYLISYGGGTDLLKMGMASAHFVVTDGEGNEKGLIKVIAEKPEEDLFGGNYTILSGRNKESCYFYCIRKDLLETDSKTFQYKRNW